MITLARSDGASTEILQAITHGPRGDIVNLYTTWPWPVLCAELAKLRVALRPLDEELATVGATAEERARKRWRKNATLTGFE